MTMEHRRAVWYLYVHADGVPSIPGEAVNELFKDSDEAVCTLEAYLMEVKCK